MKVSLIAHPHFATGVRYVPGPAGDQHLADLVGHHRVAFRSDAPPLIEDDEDGWVELHPGDWAVMCEEGCVHRYGNSELLQTYEEVNDGR